ncbi:hypothetical protein U9M48_028410 [Paspalum notatum var. saurae]|uniref:Retrotransposon gag domain-containing protein n=1 Tax=Paspalum notatum var. saurae TaxID=547442 RepID=A0AAQ3X1I1_PASNO
MHAHEWRSWKDSWPLVWLRTSSLAQAQAQVEELQQRLAGYEPHLHPVVISSDPEEMEEEPSMVNTLTGQSSRLGPQAQGALPPPELATLGQQQPWERRPCGVSYQDFEERPPIFTTYPEPLAADDWLCTIESKFTLLLELTKQEKARYAAQLLQGPAGAWHATFLAGQDRDHVSTWQEFRQAFRAHYIPASLMEQKQHEFTELKQGNITVMQYVQSFIHLSQYAPEDVADDPRRVAKLLHGFNPTLQTHLGRRYESFTDLVDTALDMESRLRIANEHQKRKRQGNSTPATSSQKPRANYQQPCFVVRPTQPGWIHRAPQQQQQYPSYCAPAQLTAPYAPAVPGLGTLASIVGDLGTSAETVTLPAGFRVPTLRAAASEESLRASAEDGACPLHLQGTDTDRRTVNGEPTVVLFDSGATHTFISKSYALKHGIEMSKIKENYHITAPGSPIDTSLVVRQLKLSIGKESYTLNPMVLPHQGIDIILGMNWMTENKAVLDIGSRTVQIRSHVSGKIVRVHMPNQKHIEPMVYATELTEIKKIPVVRDFLDVFPKELPGLPSDRDVEFRIELVPGTAPISKRPYRMAPDCHTLVFKRQTRANPYVCQDLISHI